MACFLGLLSGCAPVGRVILLPQADRSGAVVVATAAGSAELNKPYAAAELSARGNIKQTLSSEAEVRQRYPDLIRLGPQEPVRFTLRFLPGTSDLTPESIADLEEVLAAARSRIGSEILVVGHTDRKGSGQENDILSLQRASAIKDLLIAKGLSPESIEAIGRGEREPVVPTDDEVAEPRNRRAEILVR